MVFFLFFSHWDRTPSSLFLSSLLSQISCAASCCCCCFFIFMLPLYIFSSQALSYLAETALSKIAFDSHKRLTVTSCNICLKDKNQRKVQWTSNIGASSWNKFTDYWYSVRTFQFKNRSLSDKRIHSYNLSVAKTISTK